MVIKVSTKQILCISSTSLIALKSGLFVGSLCSLKCPSYMSVVRFFSGTESKISREESFGGLSGMLRQILSPSAENDELNFCNVQQQLHHHHQAALFNPHPDLQIMPPPTSPLSPHFLTVHEQMSYNDQVQVLTETHSCPHCGTKFTYNFGPAHRDQMDRLLSNTQLMHFTCQACSRTFLGQSHMKEQPPIQQPLVQVPPRMQPQQQSMSPSLSQQALYPQISGQMMSQQHQTTTSATNTDKNFSCDKCQASFRYRTLLEKHKKIHEMGAGQDKPFSCSRCPMIFETRNLYNHHAKTHKHQPEKSTASGSGNNKDNSGVLKSNNAYSCETCAKEFPTIESLTSHKAVHRSRPLICDVCGKGFTHRKYYVVHQRIHTGERPYLCAMCGKSFTQASTLTVHRRYHTGERPYTCTLCGKGFVTRTIMLNHMKKH